MASVCGARRIRADIHQRYARARAGGMVCGIGYARLVAAQRAQVSFRLVQMPPLGINGTVRQVAELGIDQCMAGGPPGTNIGNRMSQSSMITVCSDGRTSTSIKLAPRSLRSRM